MSDSEKSLKSEEAPETSGPDCEDTSDIAIRKDGGEFILEELEQDWQLGKPLGNCLPNLFEQQLWTDVCFTFPDDDTKREIKAHRSILACRSPVFEAMFYGSLADESQNIPIKEISVEAFRDVLRYLYSDRLDGNVDQLLEALAGGHRYRIDTLMEHCIRSLTERTAKQNVLTILEHALFLEQWKLVSSCMDFIDQNSDDLFELPSFLNVSIQALQLILQGNTLYNKETKILDKVTEWAKEQCLKKELATDTVNMRKFLGDAFENIRFLVLDLPTFRRHISECELLFTAEKKELSLFYNTGQNVRDLNRQMNRRVEKYATYHVTQANINHAVTQAIINRATQNSLFGSISHEYNLPECKQIFVVKPNHIFILEKIRLTTAISHDAPGKVCCIISLKSRNFCFQKEISSQITDIVEITLDKKPLLLHGYEYTFHLNLKCVSCLRHQPAEATHSVHNDTLSITTSGHNLMTSIQIRNLSGRREVKDWELAGCVDLLKDASAEELEQAEAKKKAETHKKTLSPVNLAPSFGTSVPIFDTHVPFTRN